MLWSRGTQYTVFPRARLISILETAKFGYFKYDTLYIFT